MGGGAECSAVVDEVVRGSNDPRVWRPICFLFIFAACPQNTDAWNSFLFGEPASDADWANASTAVLSNSSSMGSAESPVLQPLGLPEETLGYIGAVTTVAQASGALFYRLCLKRFTLRRLFLVIVVASSLLQLSQLILISRLNVQLGLPDVAFAIGDDAILEVSRELLAMPMMVMMAALCPSRDLTLFEPWTHPSARPAHPLLAACSVRRRLHRLRAPYKRADGGRDPRGLALCWADGCAGHHFGRLLAPMATNCRVHHHTALHGSVRGAGAAAQPERARSRE